MCNVLTCIQNNALNIFVFILSCACDVVNCGDVCVLAVTSSTIENLNENNSLQVSSELHGELRNKKEFVTALRILTE